MLLVGTAYGHSQMVVPQSTSPKVCRRGGDPNPTNCFGPCDLRAVVGRYANFDNPENPAAVYRRGQEVTIKYQRNNHGPGGFVRLTLVPPHKMMDKEVHDRNAFHYSCFGANPIRASQSDIQSDKWGFSITGNDGKDIEPGYYYTKTVIPDVIPDGRYVLGWVWYGGTGGPVSNEPYTQAPFPKGYFSDYWSCSFVEVKGGAPLKTSYTPIFKNEMNRFSEEGCMSAHDATEICKYEPCVKPATYQKPAPFKNGNIPPPLKPAYFMRGPVPESQVIERSGSAGDVKYRTENRVSLDLKKKSCACINADESCNTAMEKSTGGFCSRLTKGIDQRNICKDACCDYCEQTRHNDSPFCETEEIKTLCGMAS